MVLFLVVNCRQVVFLEENLTKAVLPTKAWVFWCGSAASMLLFIFLLSILPFYLCCVTAQSWRKGFMPLQTRKNLLPWEKPKKSVLAVKSFGCATYVKCLTDLNGSGFSFFPVIKSALQYECLSSKGLVILGKLAASRVLNEVFKYFSSLGQN